MKKYVWVDTDFGAFDAFALASAFNLENIEIVGLSCVFGKRPVDEIYKNANNFLSLLGKNNIKAYKGASKPLIVPNYFNDNVYTIKGSFNVNEIQESAIDALYKKAKELNGELYIVSIGALTNIASAIFKYPDIVKYIKEIAFGGGSVGKGGSCTLAAEENVYFDPHAAQSVFKSGIPVTMLGLDVMMESYLNPNEVNTVKESKGEIGEIIKNAIPMIDAKSKRLHGDGKLMLFDCCPFLYVNNPKLYNGRKAGVYVETESPLSMGRTVSDIYVHADELFKVKNVMVMIEADRDNIAKDVLKSFEAYK